jgi:hypothetical protein
MTRSTRHWILAAAALLLGVAGLLGYRLALQRLHDSIEASLGPRATLEAVTLDWTGVELRGLRVARAARTLAGGAGTECRARARAAGAVEPVASRLARGQRDCGRRERVPAAHEGGHIARAAEPARGRACRPRGRAACGTTLRIGELRLRDVAVDFYDASVVAGRAAPHRIRLEALHADVGPLALPALDEKAALSLQAVLRGPRRSGTLSLRGNLTPATRDADLALKAKGLDLVALQPYLLRPNEGTVRRGALDMTLNAKVKAQYLDAPGHVTLIDLELAGGEGAFGTFAGVPRHAVLAAMSRDNRIELAFKLEGRLDDPKFSLNELFAVRFAVGLANKLGVSVGGVVEGVGSVIKGLFGR